MHYLPPILLIGSSLVFSACSNEPADPADGKSTISDDNPFKAQVDSLEKAKNVEGLIEDSTKRREQHLDEQSN